MNRGCLAAIWVEQVGWVARTRLQRRFHHTQNHGVSRRIAGIQPTNFSNRFGKARSRGIWAIAKVIPGELVTLQDAMRLSAQMPTLHI